MAVFGFIFSKDIHRVNIYSYNLYVYQLSFENSHGNMVKLRY